MQDTVEIVTLAQRERWCELHQAEGLPSHSWHYANGLAVTGIEPRLAVVDSGGARLLLTFYEREWRGRRDIASILSLSGASVSTPSVAPFRAFKAYAVAQGWVAGYIQLAPSAEPYGVPEGDRILANNDVFVLDLRQGDLRGSASQIIRRKIARAERAGAVLVDKTAVPAARLCELYPATMRRIGAKPIYNFPVETLRRWACDPDTRLYGAEVDGTIEAISMFRLVRGEGEYQLNACTEEGRGLAAWLIWKAAERLAAEGVERLNLGGGVRRGDGLAEFKSKFGAARHELRALCQIYDAAAYADFCSQSGAEDCESYFPAYRAPRFGLRPGDRLPDDRRRPDTRTRLRAPGSGAP